MLNRWQAHKGAACGEVALIIMCLEVAQHCSTSSTPNDSEVSAPRRLRYRSTSGYAWSSTSGAYYTSPFCDFCERLLHIAAVTGRIAIRPYNMADASATHPGVRTGRELPISITARGGCSCRWLDAWQESAPRQSAHARAHWRHRMPRRQYPCL